MAPRLPTTAPLRCLRTHSIKPSPDSLRCLSTTQSLSRQTPSHLTVPKDQVPDYPYGDFRTYKQRNQGLYGGSTKQFGNVVAPKYGNKSRTTWLPNRHMKRLWSVSLQAFIRVRMTAHVLHTIDRLGGIDEYLLGNKARRIKHLGPAGWKLRWKIMQTDAVRQRFAREREALGLPPKEPVPDATAISAIRIAGLDGSDLTSAQVLDEVDGMIARDEEFVLDGGEVGEPIEDAERDKPVPFMHEEHPRAAPKAQQVGPKP